MRNRFCLFSSPNERSHAILGGSLGFYVGLSFSICGNNIPFPGIIMIICTTVTGMVLGNGVGRGVDAAIKLEANIDEQESDLETGLSQNNEVLHP